MPGGELFHFVTNSQSRADTVVGNSGESRDYNGVLGAVIGARKALFAETVMGRGDRKMVAVALTTVTIGLRTEGHRGTDSLLGAGAGSGTVTDASDLFQMGMIVRRQTPGKPMDRGMSGEEVEDAKERGNGAVKGRFHGFPSQRIITVGVLTQAGFRSQPPPIAQGQDDHTGFVTPHDLPPSPRPPCAAISGRKRQDQPEPA